MKLTEVIEMFAIFGFTENAIRQGLAKFEDTAQAYDILKEALKLRWEFIEDTYPDDEIESMEPTYCILMGLTMVSRLRKSDRQREKVRATVRNTQDKVRNRTRRTQEQ